METIKKLKKKITNKIREKYMLEQKNHKIGTNYYEK